MNQKIIPNWRGFVAVIISLFFLTTAMTQELRIQNEIAGEQAAEIIPEARYILEGLPHQYPAMVKLRPEANVTYTQFVPWLKRTLQMSEGIDFVEIDKSEDELGFNQYRLQQTFNGIPLDRGEYRVQVKDGKVLSFLGTAFIVNNVQTNPSLSEESALKSALSHFDDAQFLWESDYWENEIKERTNNPNASYYPKGNLVLTSFGTTTLLRLAYSFDVHSLLQEERVFVDAETGQILYTVRLSSDCEPAVSFTSIWNGSRNLRTEKYTANDYRLNDDCQATEIWVRDWNSATDVSNNPTEIENTDNVWTTQDERFGATVLWETKESYRYFLNVHSRASFDGSNGNLRCYINAIFQASNGTFHPDNASMTFSGSRMKVGLGSSGTLANSWGTMDIIAHEFTHAVTGTSSALVYQGEPGALNESFSDIFGDMVENYSVGPNDWLMGDDRTNGAIRSMSDPRSLGDPDTYLDDNWASTCNTCSDNGGVHTNSGVQNYWFYLLAVGGSGTNENSQSYSVSGVGITAASAVAFRNMVVKLGVNSNYAAARAGSIEAAEDLYGSCSNVVKQVTNAWYAVGVGNQYVDAEITSVNHVSCNGANDATINITPRGTSPYTYAWSDGPATQDRSGLGPGTYTITITDATGCTATASVEIDEPAVLVADAFGHSDYNGYNIACFGNADGIAKVTASGGTPPYGYQWDANAGSSTLFTASGLTAGTYSVTVTDANGCTDSDDATLTEPPLLMAAISNVSNYNGFNISCNGGSDGWATVSGSGGVMPYSYAWNDGANQNTATASGLSAGSYTVTITDANGCTAETSVILTEPAPLTIEAGPNQTVYYGYPPAECATIAWSGAGGGVAPYTISWSDGGAMSHQVCPGISTTTYTVTIMDANGCVETDEVTVCVIDVRCGNKLDKVQMCHVPEDDPLNTQTICVSVNSVAMHLSHGDMLAACGTDHSCPPAAKRAMPMVMDVQDNSLNVYPNPFSHNATVKFTTVNDERVILQVMDYTGKIVKTLYEGVTHEGVTQEFQLNTNGMSDGMYICVLRLSNGKQIMQRVVVKK